MIIIGSKALAAHGIIIPRPDNYQSDIDLIVDENELNLLINEVFSSWSFLYKSSKVKGKDVNGIIYELDILPSYGSSQFLHSMDTDKTIKIADFDCKVPPLNVLYAIKKSHINYPVNWFKNINDYHYLKSMNIWMDEIATHVYNLRKSEVDGRWKSVNLNVSNNEFFDQYDVTRFYEHDELHEWVKHYDVPMYRMLKHDATKALCDRMLFNELSYEQQLNTVREEAYVIALERIIIPKIINSGHLPNIDWNKAYIWALMRISTNLTTGWFRDFAVDNWSELNNCKLNLIDICKEHVYDARQI